MHESIGQSVATLDSPQAVIDLDVVDANLRTMRARCEKYPIDLRVHFKSLKCAGRCAT